MTARKPSAEDRIMQAHDRLLASVRITPDMPAPVRDALVRKGDFIESSVLAFLIGRLAGRAANGKPLSPTALAEIAEDVCAQGEKEAALVIAKATPEVPDYLHALPPIDDPGRMVGVEPGPRCGAQGRTALFTEDVTCPVCLEALAAAAPKPRLVHMYAGPDYVHALCGGLRGTATMLRADVTCPECLADMSHADGGASPAAVMHYTETAAARATCGAVDGRITPWTAEVTCPACLADMAQTKETDR